MSFVPLSDEETYAIFTETFTESLADLRVFCRLVMGIPDGDAEYNILWCYYIDPHNYDSHDLTVYDATAREQTRKVGEYDDPSSVRSYLEENNAFTATDLKERIDRF